MTEKNDPNGGWKAALEAQTKELKRNSDVMNKLIERIQKISPPGALGGAPKLASTAMPTSSSGQEEKGGKSRQEGGFIATQRTREQQIFGSATNAITAMMNPMQTAQERAANLMKSGAGAAGSFAGYGAAKALGASDQQATMAGEAASRIAESAMANRLHKDETVIGRAKGGFADMEDLAAMGFKFSDEEVKSRASRNIEMEKKRYDFQVRAGNAVGEEYGGLKGLDPAAAMSDGMNAAVDVLKVFVQSLGEAAKGMLLMNQSNEAEFRRNR